MDRPRLRIVASNSDAIVRWHRAAQQLRADIAALSRLIRTEVGRV